MILRTTQKLATRLKIASLPQLPANENPLTDWAAHLFTVDHTPYVILTNSESLYSVLMPAIGITSEKRFITSAADSIRECMDDDGFESAHQKWIAPFAESIQFARVNNRSVTGSMNDLILGAKLWLAEDDLLLNEITAKLNETPMSSLDYRSPREAFQAMCIDWLAR